MYAALRCAAPEVASPCPMCSKVGQTRQSHSLGHSWTSPTLCCWMASRGTDDLQPLHPAGLDVARDSIPVQEPAGAALSRPAIAISLGAVGASRTGWWRDDRARTALCINLACIAERVDEQLLPSLFRFVGHSFSASPSQLGQLTFSRAVVQALASPLAGGLRGLPSTALSFLEDKH